MKRVGEKLRSIAERHGRSRSRPKQGSRSEINTTGNILLGEQGQQQLRVIPTEPLVEEHDANSAIKGLEELVQTHEGNDKVLRLQRAIRPALEVVAQINDCIQLLSGVDPTGYLGPVCDGVGIVAKVRSIV